MSDPLISVVMGVHNGEAVLRQTVDSILDQEDCKLEFIVIDDGSSDGTAGLLKELAADDPRLRAFHQSNMGLTKTLRRGCELARGDFIARQDCGDISLPGRLFAQAQTLQADPDVVMVSCATRFVGRQEELVRIDQPTTEELNSGMGSLDLDSIRGPSHHGSTMFRRYDYGLVGGYRPIFHVAQDIDLWLRLHERGTFESLPLIGYEARLSPKSISFSRRNEQIALMELGIQAALARRAGQDETVLFADYKPPQQGKSSADPAHQQRAYDYYVGSLLMRTNPRQARSYFRSVLKQPGLDASTAKAMLRLLLP
jgi:glycosyltransferase involved in cell wall biosynthesis